MASGASVEQGNVVCRYFMSSSCKDGDRCLFSHDSTRGTADSVCRSYLRRGTCAYGKNCRFDHVRVNKESNSKSHPHNDRHSVGPSHQSTNRDASSNCTRSKLSKQNTHKPNFNGLNQSTKKKRFPHGGRRVHTEHGEKELEQDIELTFAIERSIDKACEICMDFVLEKKPLSERRFGILEKCNHVYCLSCIIKWRKSNQYEIDSVVSRACPECQIPSDFVIPSRYFIDTKEEKNKLIAKYKKVLSKRNYLVAKSGKTKVEHLLPTRQRQQNEDEGLDFIYDQLDSDEFDYVYDEYDYMCEENDCDEYDYVCEENDFDEYDYMQDEFLTKDEQHLNFDDELL